MRTIEIIKDLASKAGPADLIICTPGLVLLAIWLYRTSLGKNALAKSMPRRNSMPAYLPFVPLFIWLTAVTTAILTKKRLLSDLPGWKSAFLDNLIFCIGAIAVIALIIFLAREHFARRLKGFGLNPRTIPKDLAAALVNLLSVYPLVALGLIVTIFFGKLIAGPHFELQKHQELKLISQHSQLCLRVLVVITAVFVMPIFEEVLFRGMFQSMIRSQLSGFKSRISHFPSGQTAWLAIAAASGLFVAVHANMGHWPALFALAMCMGYAYEKSGSLFRPIFIHSLFNAFTIIFTLQNA